jgi:hypothetical protein
VLEDPLLEDPVLEDPVLEAPADPLLGAGADAVLAPPGAVARCRVGDAR